VLEHMRFNRNSFVDSMSRLINLRRSNEREKMIAVALANRFHVLCSEQHCSEPQTAWTKGLEDLIGGSCEHKIDSRIKELFHAVGRAGVAPTFAKRHRTSIQAFRKREEFESFQRADAGQTVLTKVLALLTEVLRRVRV